jgi:hypothetical protein
MHFPSTNTPFLIFTGLFEQSLWRRQAAVWIPEALLMHACSHVLVQTYNLSEKKKHARSSVGYTTATVAHPPRPTEARCHGPVIQLNRGGIYTCPTGLLSKQINKTIRTVLQTHSHACYSTTPWDLGVVARLVCDGHGMNKKKMPPAGENNIFFLLGS